MNEITIVIIAHKSSKTVLSFVKKIPEKYKIIIIDNSKDYILQEKIRRFKNIKIKFMKNKGYGAGINFARKFIKTRYLFAFSPDILGVNKKFLEKFEKIIKSKLEFGALGPRFLNVSQKSHKQSNKNDTIGSINAISGSAMLINIESFDDINGFDENIFLFFEENDFCKRLCKKKYKIFQINKATALNPKGVEKGVVKIKSKNIEKLQNFYGWHFMWSKFYFYKKNNNNIITIINFTPIFIRLILRIFISYLFKTNKTQKYSMRLQGLYASMTGTRSYKRINL